MNNPIEVSDSVASTATFLGELLASKQPKVFHGYCSANLGARYLRFDWAHAKDREWGQDLKLLLVERFVSVLGAHKAFDDNKCIFEFTDGTAISFYDFIVTLGAEVQTR